MKPAKEKYYRSLFTIAAVYDILLGITFTFFPERAFDALGIREKLPAFGGYLTLLGAFVFVIGIAYLLIATRRSAAEPGFDPRRHALQTGLLGNRILLLVGGQHSSCHLRRPVRRGRRGLFHSDGGVLLLPDPGNQALTPFSWPACSGKKFLQQRLSFFRLRV